MLTWLKFIIKIVSLSFITLSVWAEIVFIPLYNRPTDEILTVIQQTFPNIPISSYGGQLVVNGSVSEVKQVQALISELDIPARQLLITVDDSGSQQFYNQSYHTYNNMQLGDRKRFERNHRAIQSTGRTLKSNLKQLLVNEGSPTLIQTGQSIPVVYQGYDSYGRPIRTTQYMDTMQSLYVSVRVVGQQVYIDITNQNNSLHRSGTINQQVISSHISGTLDTWINLGNFQQINNNNRKNYRYSQQNNNYSNNQIRIRVELVN